MELIQVKTPKFEYEGQELYVEEKIFGNLQQFDDENDEYKRNGFTKCFFYSLQHEPESAIYFIRRIYIK